ncbi:FAD-binding oxidoreductase [Sorangium sp. So ce1128]
MTLEVAMREFQTSLRGEVLFPSDAGYDSARRVFNAMIDKRPRLIARCAEPADIVRCVRFAREHALPASVRGGGHSVAGKAVCDAGMMIDLSQMKAIRVDPTERTARAEPGLLLGEFDEGTQAFGFATTMGIMSTTGIAGLTLGGGIGWLNGKHGLACDNLLSAEVVTANGDLVVASSSENPDLFWGMRGGGGNFGIVTSFEYRVHPVGQVLAGMLLYPLAKAKRVLRFFDDFSSACPDEFSTTAVLMTGEDGQPALAVLVCYCGPLADGEAALRPLRSFAKPTADLISPTSYVEFQRLLDPAFPPGMQHYWKSGFMRRLSDTAIDILVEHTSTMPSPLSSLSLQQMHGVAGRLGVTDTAFAHRQDQYDFVITSTWKDPAETDTNVRWTRELYKTIRPFLEGGVYVNNLGAEDDDVVRAAYGPNYNRLMDVKRKYDPTNFFCMNHNILPNRPA